MQNFMRTGKKGSLGDVSVCRGIRIPIMHGTYWSAIPRKPPRGFWNMAGAWISMHIMEHYRFGGDKGLSTASGTAFTSGKCTFLPRLAGRRSEKQANFVVGPDVSAENTYLFKRRR